jgi:hypothetical protein
MKATLRYQLAVIALATPAALAAAWFWALRPMLAPISYLHPLNWTEADLVRHLWHFRLVQAEWIGSPPRYDILRWMQAETLARWALVWLGWYGGCKWLLRRHLRREAVTPPGHAASGHGATA